jgi:YebC/PmpR family DNA-binding regulatory protein
MSGHSKWSTIKHKKGAADAKRGKLFTKVIKELTVASRAGGSDIDGNPRLRAAVAAAKNANMPRDTMERAIKRGAGEIEGANYEEVTYEAYGAGGVAIIVDCLTDNRNRTAGEIRQIFTKNNGALGEVGCVGFMFQRKGLIVVEKSATSEDVLMEMALEAGAEDVRDGGDNFEVLTAPTDFEPVRAALEAKGVPMMSAEVTRVPSTTVKVAGSEARSVMKLVDALEDNDDVQHVYANFEIDDAEMEQLAQSA